MYWFYYDDIHVVEREKRYWLKSEYIFKILIEINFIYLLLLKLNINYIIQSVFLAKIKSSYR